MLISPQRPTNTLVNAAYLTPLSGGTQGESLVVPVAFPRFFLAGVAPLVPAEVAARLWVAGTSPPTLHAPVTKSLRRVPAPPRRMAALLPHPQYGCRGTPPDPRAASCEDHPPPQASTAHGIGTTAGPAAAGLYRAESGTCITL